MAYLALCEYLFCWCTSWHMYFVSTCFVEIAPEKCASYLLCWGTSWEMYVVSTCFVEIPTEKSTLWVPALLRYLLTCSLWVPALLRCLLRNVLCIFFVEVLPEMVTLLVPLLKYLRRNVHLSALLRYLLRNALCEYLLCWGTSWLVVWEYLLCWGTSGEMAHSERNILRL